MSSSEIEDVLSSIRRLVSEDLRPLTRPGGTHRIAPKPVEPDKLLLTPALRVVQAAAVAAPEPQRDLPRPPASAPESLPMFVATPRMRVDTAPDAPFAEVDSAPIGQVVSHLGAAVTAHPQEWEPEHGDLPPPAPAGEIWAMPEIDFAIDLGGPEPAAAPVDPVARPDSQAAIGAAVADAVAAPPEEPVAEPEVAVMFTHAEMPAWAQDDDGQDAMDGFDPGQESAMQGTIEPDADWADAAEASVIAALQAEADGAQARRAPMHEAAGDSDDDEMRFDETVLRELVRDILREELAGPMGERITRNIRKLVRSEIAMILATQGID